MATTVTVPVLVTVKSITIAFLASFAAVIVTEILVSKD